MDDPRRLYTIAVCALVACLWFGSEGVRIIAGLLLLIGAWPAFLTLRQHVEEAAEQRGYISALSWAKACLQREDDQDSVG